MCDYHFSGKKTLVIHKISDFKLMVFMNLTPVIESKFMQKIPSFSDVPYPSCS